MNWAFPGNTNQIQKDFYNTDPNGMQSLFQNLNDFYANQGQNLPMASFFKSMYGQEQNRYNMQAIQNPELTWGQWLQQRAPQLFNNYNMLAPSMRGQNPGFVRPGREVW
jgi:hypothetical protein